MCGRRASRTAAVFVWLFLLNFGRGFKSLGRFILLTERMAVDMINWLIVFAVEVLGFAVAFEILYDTTDSRVFGTLGIGWFTLTKWTLGEFDWHDWDESASTPTAFIMFGAFVTISSVILFNMLIAMMAST